MNSKVNKKYIRRRRASVIMLLCFIMLIPSGIMMHLNDSPGLNESKHHAMMLHNMCAVIFVAAGVFHIKYNFNPVKKYIAELFSGFCLKK